MKEELDLIKSRRSVREYTDKVPSDKDIEKILEAGRWAPSGLNNQPWRFVIIKDKETNLKVSKLTHYADIVKAAPILIAVFLDKDAMYDRDKDALSTGACIQNMLLEAHSLGLGTCWLGEILKRKGEVSEVLGVSKNFELMAVLTLGYPVPKQRKSTRKSLKELVIKEI